MLMKDRFEDATRANVKKVRKKHGKCFYVIAELRRSSSNTMSKTNKNTNTKIPGTNKNTNTKIYLAGAYQNK